MTDSSCGVTMVLLSALHLPLHNRAQYATTRPGAYIISTLLGPYQYIIFMKEQAVEPLWRNLYNNRVCQGKWRGMRSGVVVNPVNYVFMIVWISATHTGELGKYLKRSLGVIHKNEPSQSSEQMLDFASLCSIWYS